MISRGVPATTSSMPEMSGMDFAQQLLQIRPNTPIVITSGYIRPQDKECVRRMGLPDILLKPDTIEQLAKALNDALAERKKSAAEKTPDDGCQDRAAAAGYS
jgi:DNA-binding NarL/FixJ family response regulator